MFEAFGDPLYVPDERVFIPQICAFGRVFDIQYVSNAVRQFIRYIVKLDNGPYAEMEEHELQSVTAPNK
ncbi:MAG: hypothetical protein ACM3ZC_13615 [Bacteroidota bacterium]